MKHLPYRTDPDSGELSLFAYCSREALSHGAAEDGNHAIRAADAYERATIVLRLLIGEREWSDGYERKLDDCFEMNDGNAVAGWLIEFAENDPRIRKLLLEHNHTQIKGSDILTHWTENGWRNAHRIGELQLS